jgi:hypothetical protein
MSAFLVHQARCLVFFHYKNLLTNIQE